MADQDFLAAINNLSIRLDNLNQNVGASQIKSFDGDSKEFKRWIKSIEKYAYLEGIPVGKIKLIAFKTSSGAVSDFIQRYVTKEPTVKWEDLKGELSIRFDEISDAQHAFMLLRQVKQGKTENVQIYAERLLSLAEQAYEGQQENRVTEGQMIGFFIDGLYSDRLKLKVMRDNPRDMQAAINSARAEHNLQQRFQLRTGRNYFVPTNNTGEPMEIDHFRYRRGARRNRNDQLQTKQYDRRKNISAIEQNQNTSEIFCWTCNKKGHISRDCTFAKVTCWNCNRKGHISRDCTARKVEAITAAIDNEMENWDEELN